MVTITCSACEFKGEPVKEKKDLVCSKCDTPFNYFKQVEYNNRCTKERVAKERAAANKKLTRGLKK